MINSLFFLLYLIAGFMVGVLYLLALWHNIQGLSNQNKTKKWFLLNAFLRVLIVVAIFYFLSSGNWFRLLGLLLGFMIVRYIGIKKIIKKIENTVSKTKEAELKV